VSELDRTSKNFMNILSLLRTRRAIRKYTAEPVTREIIEQILDAARWAPSSHNRQPWRFAVLTQPSEKDRLARAMGARLRADRTADGDAPADIEKDVAKSYRRITGAPVVIVMCLSMTDMDRYPDERRRQNEWILAAQSVAMAGQNMWLMAHGIGLGMNWVCAPLFVPKLVRQTLALPADWEPVGLMTLGYPAESPQKTRQSLNGKVMWK